MYVANGIHEDAASASGTSLRSCLSVRITINRVRLIIDFPSLGSGLDLCTRYAPQVFSRCTMGLVCMPFCCGLKYLMNVFPGVTLFFSIPKAGIRFGGNAWCKKLLADDKGKLTMGKQFLAGMGAGILEAIFAVTPMETIKTKLIEKNLSFVSGMKVLWKEGGIRGLYQARFLLFCVVMSIVGAHGNYSKAIF